ncbi:Creatinase/aminopeptidase [Cryphonectria parasitica EP155]|uniref:Xaa-Pro aminopeptidase n=1 Tax=Cryphonectria parasitica (strain ATCC 38755 / EP155) TaxID=660469 RepID=A0A9P5CTR4_CRYP1|nr:Creatinase/aminopeptidase [Cryphonectria parasitica EP155]KAF3769967.1 Creatinase/aminopeptidase [Cryphonectria parasitica EP155]
MDKVNAQLVDIDEFDAISIEIQLGESKKHMSSESRNFDKYPAKLHAHKVRHNLGVSCGLVYLPGQVSTEWEDTDGEAPFRQHRYAFYLSGANFPGVVVTYDIGRDNLILWVPVRAPARVIWVGALPSIEECAARYDVDAVRDIKGLQTYLCGLLNPQHNPPTLYVLHESQQPDLSQERCRNGSDFQLDAKRLQPAMDISRSVKTPYEIAQIRKAVDISSEAHRAVQQSIKTLSSEAQVENVFVSKCRELGAKKQAYPPIAGSGPNAAVLHYTANNQDFGDRQLMVLDASAEFNCYASDVTRTFPLNGKFSDEAKRVYQIVADMQETCISMIRPGASWREISLKARDVAYRGLLSIGLLQPGRMGQSPDPMAVSLFFMHGLGHLIGLDTHDVIEGVRSWEQLAPLPTPPLLKDMVITCEPGLYFNRAYIEAALTNQPEMEQYINKTVLEKYYLVCGCRIEDCILVTQDGYENLTSAPKGEEMIKFINGEKS